MKELHDKAVQCFLNKDYKKAARMFSEISEKVEGEDLAYIYHYLALTYSHLGNFKISMSMFDLSIKTKESPLSYFNKGLTIFFFVDSKRISKAYLNDAVQCVDQAISLSPSVPEFWYYRGFFLEKLGRRERAKQSYKVIRTMERDFVNREGSKIYSKSKI